MISLKGNSDVAKKICDFYDEKGVKHPIWFHQKIKTEYRNVLEDVRPILAEATFREKHDLSLKEVDLLADAIRTESVPEDSKLRRKYFKTKRSVNALTISEMSVEDSTARFEINISEDRRKFEGGWQLTSASSGGKTHYFRTLVERNWRLSQNKRRPLVMINDLYVTISADLRGFPGLWHSAVTCHGLCESFCSLSTGISHKYTPVCSIAV